jgi:uncharacterized OsmC-like protein
MWGWRRIDGYIPGRAEMSEKTLVNGVEVDELGKKADALRAEPELGKFHFHAQNRWLGGGHSRTTVESFHGLGEEIPHTRTFVIDADEPIVLLGGDEGANPVEHLLNALVTCLTGAMVYHAAVRGIHIEELESTVEGDIDIRGFMGITDEVRKGYQNIRVTFRVKSDAPAAKLEECARFSPVFDVVTNGTEVDLQVEPV